MNKNSFETFEHNGIGIAIASEMINYTHLFVLNGYGAFIKKVVYFNKDRDWQLRKLNETEFRRMYDAGMIEFVTDKKLSRDILLGIDVSVPKENYIERFNGDNGAEYLARCMGLCFQNLVVSNKIKVMQDTREEAKKILREEGDKYFDKISGYYYRFAGEEGKNELDKLKGKLSISEEEAERMVEEEIKRVKKENKILSKVKIRDEEWTQEMGESMMDAMRLSIKMVYKKLFNV